MPSWVTRASAGLCVRFRYCVRHVRGWQILTLNAQVSSKSARRTRRNGEKFVRIGVFWVKNRKSVSFLSTFFVPAYLNCSIGIYLM